MLFIEMIQHILVLIRTVKPPREMTVILNIASDMFLTEIRIADIRQKLI